MSLPSFSQTLTLKEAFETAAQLNKEVKCTEQYSMEHFVKDSNFYLIEFLHFFAKFGKSVEKNMGHRMSKIIKFIIAMAICPVTVHVTT